jgi:hypothetical protein
MKNLRYAIIFKAVIIKLTERSDFQNSSFVIHHSLDLIRIKGFHPGFYQFIRPIFQTN